MVPLVARVLDEFDARRRRSYRRANVHPTVALGGSGPIRFSIPPIFSRPRTRDRPVQFVHGGVERESTDRESSTDRGQVVNNERVHHPIINVRYSAFPTALTQNYHLHNFEQLHHPVLSDLLLYPTFRIHWPQNYYHFNIFSSRQIMISKMMWKRFSLSPGGASRTRNRIKTLTRINRIRILVENSQGNHPATVE